MQTTGQPVDAALSLGFVVNKGSSVKQLHSVRRRLVLLGAQFFILGKSIRVRYFAPVERVQVTSVTVKGIPLDHGAKVI